MENRILMDSPVGPITLAEENGSIVRVEFGTCLEAGEKTSVLQNAEDQLRAYFAGRLQSFDLPVEMKGTPFQKAVWQALCQIPFGETRSYKDIAIAVGQEKSCRAVGMANHRNPVSIIVPCHRVIGADGSLTGYGGGLEIKKYLLNLEGIKIK